MRVFRLCERRHSKSVLSDEGGLHFDGRWHSQGRRIVYCASCEALAVLEVRVHVGRFMRRTPFTMHEIELPDEAVETLSRRELPKQWHRVSPSKRAQELGDAWLERNKALALAVPSIHSHSDRNILINPAHEAAGRIKVVARRPYEFDPRLFGKALRAR